MFLILPGVITTYMYIHTVEQRLRFATSIWQLIYIGRLLSTAVIRMRQSARTRQLFA